MYKKLVKSMHEIKQIESNRKLCVSVASLVCFVVLVILGKIDQSIFKDMFIIVFALYTSANLIAKHIANQRK